jgi:hypothetical protein
MDCTSSRNSNPVERFVACFDTVGQAAKAAEISTEMLRQFRRRGHVATRDRALVMARACGERVTAAELLALGGDSPTVPIMVGEGRH